MRIALVGYGHVGQAFARILHAKRSVFPFLISGVQRTCHAVNLQGLPIDPVFQTPGMSVGQFLDYCQPEVMLEITTLEPATGEPAISHIREAFARGIHVVTANKGPISHAYAKLRDEAAARQLQFRFESICMDGAPVFSMARNCLPGARILGFSGVLNSTSKVVIEAMCQGKTIAEGIAEAQALGIAEADPSYDLDGWDSAAKAAALANVLLDAHVTPLDVERQGIADLTPQRLQQLRADGKTISLVSRGSRDAATGDLKLSARAETLDLTDPLATMAGSSNLLFLETDLMGTIGTVALHPGVEQTAYGLFSDLVDIARSL